MNKMYTFYKDGVEYATDNLSAFCKDHELRRSHMADVACGARRGYKGWSKVKPEDFTPPQVDDGSMTVEQVLNAAEIAARAQNDPAYEKLVMDRVARVRRGEPLEVIMGD